MKVPYARGIDPGLVARVERSKLTFRELQRIVAFVVVAEPDCVERALAEVLEIRRRRDGARKARPNKLRGRAKSGVGGTTKNAPGEAIDNLNPDAHSVSA